MHIVLKENVYKAVVYNSYRFPNKELQKILKERRDELKPIIKHSKKVESDDNLSNYDKSPLIHYDILHTTQLREYHKLILMLNFLKQFNIDILETTYVTVFYFYANEVGKDCREYKDFRELLAKEKIDAVTIGTVDHWHALTSIAAM